MKLYTEKQVLIKKYVLEKIKCDICKKDIEDETYYEVTTSHNEWGNDSWESLHTADICSDKCLSKMFNEYLELNSDTKKIEVEKVNRKNRDGLK